jgi:hypothetical protein
LPLACFVLEIWFLSAKFSFYRGILQWFFFLFIFQGIAAIDSQLFLFEARAKLRQRVTSEILWKTTSALPVEQTNRNLRNWKLKSFDFLKIMRK